MKLFEVVDGKPINLGIVELGTKLTIYNNIIIAESEYYTGTYVIDDCDIVNAIEALYNIVKDMTETEAKFTLCDTICALISKHYMK